MRKNIEILKEWKFIKTTNIQISLFPRTIFFKNQKRIPDTHL